MPAAGSSTRHNQVLDYLRFAAAMAVVFFHLFFVGMADGVVTSIVPIPWLESWAKYGYLGVDLFFMISGFVICFSALRRTPAQYAVGRAVRIYPAFLFAMCLTTVVGFWLGAGQFDVTPRQFIANLTVMPHWFEEMPIDVVYWTLALELKFYGLIFAVVWAFGAAKLAHFIRVWPFAIALATVFDLNWVYLSGYYDYFAAGALFALYASKPDRIALIGILTCIPVSIFHAIAKADGFSTEYGTQFSPWVVTGFVLILYLGFALITRPRASRIALPMSRTLGALTYPIYLIHAHIGFMVLNRYADASNQLWMYAAIISGVLIVSYGIHRLIEQAMAPYWTRLFDVVFGVPIRWLERIRPPKARNALS